MLGVLSAIMSAGGGSGPFNPSKMKIGIEGPKWVVFPHLFNPTDIKLGRKVTWKCQPGTTSEGAKAAPYFVFGGGGDTLSFSAVLDCSEEREGDLKKEIEALYDMNYPHTAISGETTTKRGQLVCIKWRDFAFTGVVDSVDVTVNLFDPAGRMKRATVGIAMQGHAFLETDPTTANAKKFFEEGRATKTAAFSSLTTTSITWPTPGLLSFGI